MNGVKALIYEDDRAALGRLEPVFNGLGIEIVIGPDLAVIVDTVREVAPSVILLAADMKGSFSACLKVKKDKDLRNIPLLMISGRTPADVITKHQKLPTRADEYLSTPLPEGHLEEILRSRLPDLPARSRPDPEPPASDPVPPGPEPAREPPKQQARGDQAPEIPVDDVMDRTVVSSRGFEASVVNFVEDEVRGLRDTVVRLQSEKDGLHGKIDELETLLRSQSQMFDSGLRALREHQETIERTSRSEVSRVEDMNRLIDDAVRDAVAQALKQAGAAAEEARQALESDLADAKSRIEDLKGQAEESTRQRRQIAKLEKALEESRRRGADAAREMEETTALFARLESGYKETILTLEEERDVLRERVSQAEDEIEILNSDVRGFREMADRFPALQEAAAKNEVLSEENRRQAELIEKLEAQAASLETAEQRAHDLGNEVMKLRSSEQAVRDELADLRTKFNQVRSLLGLSQLDGEESREAPPAVVKGRSE